MLKNHHFLYGFLLFEEARFLDIVFPKGSRLVFWAGWGQHRANMAPTRADYKANLGNFACLMGPSWDENGVQESFERRFDPLFASPERPRLLSRKFEGILTYDFMFFM